MFYKGFAFLLVLAFVGLIYNAKSENKDTAKVVSTVKHALEKDFGYNSKSLDNMTNKETLFLYYKDTAKKKMNIDDIYVFSVYLKNGVISTLTNDYGVYYNLVSINPFDDYLYLSPFNKKDIDTCKLKGGNYLKFVNVLKTSNKKICVFSLKQYNQDNANFYKVIFTDAMPNMVFPSKLFFGLNLKDPQKGI